MPDLLCRYCKTLCSFLVILVILLCILFTPGVLSAQGTQAQSIQFLPISDRPVTSAPFQVVALSSAYLPVTLQVQGPAMLSGRLLTLTGVGQVTVTAAQAGNADYAPATAQLSFQSQAVTPTISVSPVTVPYGTPASSYAFSSTALASPFVDATKDTATVTSQLDTSVLSPGNAPEYLPDSPVFRYEGYPGVGPSTGVNDGGGYIPLPVLPHGTSFTMAFTCDCAQFEFEIQARQASYRLWVDGAYTSVDAIQDTRSYPKRLFVLVSFPDKRLRDIKIVDGGAAPFYGVYTAKDDTILSPQNPIGPPVMILGDSWTGPTILEPAIGPEQPGTNGSGYPQTLGEFFNWNHESDGVGGSGFTNVGTDPAGRTFVGRIVQDLCPNPFQSVFLLGGVNDSASEADEQAAVSQALSDIASCEPGSPIYLYGPQVNAQPAIDAAMATAVAQATPRVYYNDIKEANWIYGSSTDASTGNAYLYFNGHPTPLGHDFLAEMFAADLVHHFPDLMPKPYPLLLPAPLRGANVMSQVAAMPAPGVYPVSFTFTPDDTAHFTPATASTTLTITQATTTTTATATLLNGSATLTATVAPQVAGVPTGTVTFTDQESGQVLATAPLTNGVATAQLALGTLSAGQHSASATYSGDTNFLASTAQAPATFVATTPDFSFSLRQTQLTLTPGSSGTVALTAVSSGGLTGPLSVQCAGLPQNASCSLSGVPTLNGASIGTTLTIAAYTPTASLAPAGRLPWWPAGGAGALCCLVGGLPLWRRRRTFARYAALIALCALASAGLVTLTGCGSTAAIRYATPGAYAVQVTLTANAGTPSAVSHVQPITVNIP